ncbi:hypothetical protein B0H14DRAFT_2617777 [Mycena olivaceomarginata]|nr:hypothetical protein B0H14DRAFT_2617777 [Mycena olivaceomarginata]
MFDNFRDIEHSGIVHSVLEAKEKVTHHWCNESSGRSDGIEGDERKSFKVFFVSEKSERGPGCRTNENAPSIGALVPKLRRRLRESSANWFIRAPETRERTTEEGKHVKCPEGTWAGAGMQARVSRAERKGSEPRMGHSGHTKAEVRHGRQARRTGRAVITLHGRTSSAAHHSEEQARKRNVCVGVSVQGTGCCVHMSAQSLDATLSVGDCRDTGAPMGRGGRGRVHHAHAQRPRRRGIGATTMDGWNASKGRIWGSRYPSDTGVQTRMLSPGQGQALRASRGARAYSSAHGGLARCRTRMPVGVGACRASGERARKASTGSRALQVTAGMLWAAVGMSTRWQREQDASEGAFRRTWARYGGGGNRTSGIACKHEAG